jgi:REP element-mobilizing transposase RayT
MSVRRLPHLYPENRWLFITWSLRGALRPAQFPPPNRALSGELFLVLDRALDIARAGPMFLRQDAIASIIARSLHRGVELGHYELGSFAIMANHVHVLLLPKVDVSTLMKSLKGYTAREANRLLGRTGIPFWQKESYDHWVRDETEWNRIARYIENNPVKAGLVPVPEAYRWSSAFERQGGATSGDAARLGARATSAD